MLIKRNNGCFLVLVIFLFFFSLDVDAEPFIPKSDSEVLEHLSTSSGKVIPSEIKRLRTQADKDPQNKEKTTAFIKRCIELSHTESDPRYLGYGESILRKRNIKSDPELLVLSGIIKQSNHDFYGALEDLSLAIKKDKSNAQASLT